MTTAITASLQVTAAPAHVDDVAFPYSGMTSRSVVSGVVAADGVAVQGADVLAIAYPAGDALDVPEGTDLGTLVVGAAGTDSLGRFSVNVDPSALPAPYVDDRGRVHLEIAISHGDREVHWTTTAVRSSHATPIGGTAERCGAYVRRDCDPGDPVYVVPGMGGSERLVVIVGTAGGRPVLPLWSTASSEAAGASVPRQLVVDLGARPSVADANDDPATWVTAPAGEPVAPVPEGEAWAPPATPPPAPSRPIGAAAALEAKLAEATPRSPAFPAIAAAIRDRSLTPAQITEGRMAAAGRSPGPCVSRVVKRHNGREETYMGVYAWSGALATVTQADGADHTLSVGTGGAHGKWSSSGSLTLSVRVGNSHTVSRVADAWAIGTVNYGVIANSCDGRRNLVPMSLGDPIKRFARAYHPALKAQCITLYGKSSVWDKDQARNVRIGGGVTVAGFSASAQSGYDTRSKLSFRPTKLTRLCGNRSVGVRLSSIIEAHKG
ncbi:hypothetical protein [Sphaerisporangium perillae]|uniref:hypothetical protein n=1 Tax=Sphaerisporangium perillae TaxID=2935860 RepID=UPI00200D7BAE|nr:hypothetical protein [Sphaerisporangium perillae]